MSDFTFWATPLRPMFPRNYGSQGTQWSLITPPVQEPITVTDARNHCRYAQTNNDGQLMVYIRAAREAAEDYMGRALFTQTWKLELAYWANPIYLPRAYPLQNDSTATPSTAPIVEYYDVNGVLQTLDPSFYVVDTLSRPGRLLRAPNQVFPSLQADRSYGGRVFVTYVAGYADIGLIPERIKQGIRIYTAWMDANREGMDPSVYRLQPDVDRSQIVAEACWSDRVEWIEPNWEGYWPWPV